jgi:hypothetical protein
MENNTNIRLRDVQKSFNAIDSQGDKSNLHGGEVSVSKGHVQGICASSRHYVLTHDHPDADEGYFQVFDKEDGQQVRRTKTDVEGFNHPGGCQEIGSYMVVGIENGDNDKGGIWLYSLQGIEDHGPKKLRHLVKRGDQGVGGAGITEFTHDGKPHWLTVAMDNGDLDFFVSNGESLEDPACEFTKSFNAKLKSEDDSASTVSLLTDKDNDIYLIAFVLRGDDEDHAVLYKVNRHDHTISRIKDRHMFTTHGTGGILNPVHFRWGAGVNIRDEEHFDLLATQRLFDGKAIPFAINTFKG